MKGRLDTGRLEVKEVNTHLLFIVVYSVIHVYIPVLVL